MASWPAGAIDVTTPEEARRAAHQIAHAPELAVDVEADAMHAFRARLCFVQVGTDASVFLFDTLVPEVPPAMLAHAFEDPAKTKFFHAAGGDLQFLAEQGVRVNGLFDTHRAVTLLGWTRVGLADLARELLGVELAKEHQQSDFSIRPLPDAVRAYIADDVRYLIEIGRRIREECRKADILEEVELDCRRLAEEAAARPDQSAAFRLKFSKQAMKPKEVALAQALARRLHQLRLRWAEAADVPMGRVLSNAAIASIATRPPSSVRELSKAIGVRGAFVREHGEEILALVRELIARSRDGELEMEPEEREAIDPARRKRAEALKAWRSEKATQRKVTPSVVLPNTLLDELAAAPPPSVDALGGLHWLGEKRVRLYGEELVTLLARHRD
jgi:ribonuclease D